MKIRNIEKYDFHLNSQGVYIVKATLGNEVGQEQEGGKLNERLKEMHRGSFSDKSVEEMLWKKPDISDILEER